MAPRGKGIKATEIGRRIKLARKESGGMTQRELGDLLGVTERSVAGYEAGEVIPYRFLRQLESALNRPAAWILYGDEAAMNTLDTLPSILRRLEEIEAVQRQILQALKT